MFLNIVSHVLALLFIDEALVASFFRPGYSSA